MKKTAGFTLVEFVIANFLALTILSLMMNMYIKLRTTYYQISSLSDLLHNARFVTYFFHKKLQAVNQLSQKHRLSQTEYYIKAYHRQLPSYLANGVKANTDVLEINFCQGNKYSPTAYFVGNTNLKSPDGRTIFALYQKNKNGLREEIISGVENFIIEFGIACPDGLNICNYVRADNISAWNKVVSIHLFFDLVSTSIYFPVATSYYFYHNRYPPDKRLHKQWHIYLGLRHGNQIPQ